GYRTLYPTVIPPGAAHVDGVFSTYSPQIKESETMLALSAQWASLPFDFVIRVLATANLFGSLIDRLPANVGSSLNSALAARAGRLNCLSRSYAPMWTELTGDSWTPQSAARKDEERRQLMLEIDALAAILYGITADELCAIYRTQFGVLRKYEEDDLYDANGRLVPKEIAKAYRERGEQLTEAERLWTHPQSGVEYLAEFPFRGHDREEDMREAYARFAEELEKTGTVE
ncbi:MAG: hypothetical protein Q4P33_09650, partial [Flaviflexus sp.]|nr:hypothetical protein [Flaviflexus sp.]